jgi:hypothetical protein
MYAKIALSAMGLVGAALAQPELPPCYHDWTPENPAYDDHVTLPDDAECQEGRKFGHITGHIHEVCLHVQEVGCWEHGVPSDLELPDFNDMLNVTYIDDAMIQRAKEVVFEMKANPRIVQDNEYSPLRCLVFTAAGHGTGHLHEIGMGHPGASPLEMWDLLQQKEMMFPLATSMFEDPDVFMGGYAYVQTLLNQ